MVNILQSTRILLGGWRIFCGTMIVDSKLRFNMDRGKIVAIATGAISVLIAIAYLLVVLLLDSRGEMIPAPIDQISYRIISYVLL